jgi:hypothetical protein
MVESLLGKGTDAWDWVEQQGALSTAPGAASK